MNWTWNVRSNDGAMNGLEFARCTTAGGFGRVLIHAAPAEKSHPQTVESILVVGIQAQSLVVGLDSLVQFIEEFDAE